MFLATNKVGGSHSDVASNDDSDDDFIEVRDKSGFEASVQAEDHLLGIDFYPAINQPSTSKGLVFSRIFFTFNVLI